MREHASLVVLLAALSACPKTPTTPRYRGQGATTAHSGGTFRFYGESNVRTLDPHIAYDELSIMAARLLYEPLLDFDLKGRLAPGLASLPRYDATGLELSLTLRSDVRFHDGTPLNAAAVKRSLERMLAPKTGSPGLEFFRKLEGLKAYRAGAAAQISGILLEGEYELKLRLTDADATFAYALAMGFAMPVAPSALSALESDGRLPAIGTGPYRLAHWERGVKLHFSRFDTHWRKRPGPQTQIFYENVARHLAIMRFRNGELDVLYSFSPADITFFRRQPSWQPYLETALEPTIGGLVMNCEIPPFDNVHVRRAVALALNRDRWREARGRNFESWGQPLPPMIAGALPEDHAAVQRYNVDAARKELALAGHPDGFEESIELWIGESRSAQIYGEFAQADLAAIGLRVELKPVSFAVYLDETGKRGRVPLFFSAWRQDFPDAASFLDILFHSAGIRDTEAQNRAFYANPALDALLDRAKRSGDGAERRRLYEQASTLLAQDAPWAFLYVPTSHSLRQPYVRNLVVHPVWTHPYDRIWLDLPRKRW